MLISATFNMVDVQKWESDLSTYGTSPTVVTNYLLSNRGIFRTRFFLTHRNTRISPKLIQHANRYRV
jgi:hypothetical protein